MDVLYGLHPVEEALRAGARRMDHVSVAKEREARRDPRLERVLELCREAGIRVQSEPRDQLTRLARTDAHQGVVAFLRERALLRSADGAGIDGVVLPERRSAPLSAVVAKSSAGASEHVRIAQVTNLVRALEMMKQRHVWIVGLDERGAPEYSDFDFRQNCCLVLGSEGSGLHDLVKRNCDYLLRIPMAGSVSSLNVSVAGALVMYEAMRQRRGSAVPPPLESKPERPRKGLGS